MKPIPTWFAASARRLRIDWAEAAPHTSGAARATLQANFGAVVLNGLFFPTAGKILGAGLLLTWFLDELTSSAFVVGLLIPIQYGASLLAQPWIGQWISTRSPRVRYYRDQALVRAVVWIALAGALMWKPEHTSALLAIFFAVVVLDAIAAGVGNIAFSDTLARAIPEPLRGRARGGRGMAGAIVAGITGIAIHRLVSPESGIGVFALLFGLAGLCYALGGLTFGMIAEKKPDRCGDGRTAGESETLRSRVREMFAAPGYRRFLAVQALLIPATLGLTFFSLFGRRDFSLDLKAFGLLVVSDALAPLIGNWFWGRSADRLGNRWVLALSGSMTLIAPAIAIVLSFARQPLSAPLVLAAFGAIVLTLGIAATGVDLASKNFILELAPDARRRPVYIGVNDTLIAVPTMALAVGGVVIDRAGFRPVFFAIAACSLFAVLLMRALPARP